MQIADALSCFAEVCYKPLGDRGEDAFAYDFSRGDVHTQAVFDGCGGAGAWRYPEFHNATGAFVAAQSVSKYFLRWSKGLSTASLENSQSVAEDFRQMASRQLIHLKDTCAPMGVSGTLVKSFPCTASIAFMTMTDRGTISLTALNAGDSRVYFLTPDRGLVQLTSDDSRGKPDPLQSLRDSAPLSNLLNADKPFTVDARHIELSLPCAILCVTDGAFGYLRSPMDFEYLLLRCIDQSTTVQQFETDLTNTIKEVTGDDSTLIMSFYGWDSCKRIQADLKGRLKYIQSLVKRMDAAGDNFSETQSVIAQLWADYKRDTVIDETKG